MARKLVKWSEDDLPEAVANATCWQDVVEALGLSTTAAGNWRTVQKYTKKMGLDTSHFDTNTPQRRAGLSRKMDISDILVENSDFRTHHLKRRLIDEGLKDAICECCGLSEWLGEPIALELDHVNGVPNDHRIENLRILCPNCHAQTPTWRGRNKVT